jgi:hypothetical protein
VLREDLQELMDVLVNQYSNACLQQTLVNYLVRVFAPQDPPDLADNVINRMIVGAASVERGIITDATGSALRPDLSTLNATLLQMVLATIYGGRFFDDGQPKPAQELEAALTTGAGEGVLSRRIEEQLRMIREREPEMTAEDAIRAIIGAGGEGTITDPTDAKAQILAFARDTLPGISSQSLETTWSQVSTVLRRSRPSPPLEE